MTRDEALAALREAIVGYGRSCGMFAEGQRSAWALERDRDDVFAKVEAYVHACGGSTEPTHEICDGSHVDELTVHTMTCAHATIRRQRETRLKQDSVIAEQRRRILAVSEILADSDLGKLDRIADAIDDRKPLPTWARDAEHERVVSGTEPLNSAALDNRKDEP